MCWVLPTAALKLWMSLISQTIFVVGGILLVTSFRFFCVPCAIFPHWLLPRLVWGQLFQKVFVKMLTGVFKVAAVWYNNTNTKETEEKMKKFFAEFKKFIARGNVMDMAVGMIVGAAFTAIVTALSDGILKPIINMIIYFCCGGDQDALAKMYTPLVKVWQVDAGGNELVGVLDMDKSILIDWGAFLSSVINFLLVAIVLFSIVKVFNAAREASETTIKKLSDSPFSREELKALRKEGKTHAEIAELEEKRRAEIAEEERLAAEEAAKNAPKTQEQLLQEIIDLLTEKQEK